MNHFFSKNSHHYSLKLVPLAYRTGQIHLGIPWRYEYMSSQDEFTLAGNVTSALAFRIE